MYSEKVKFKWGKKKKKTTLPVLPAPGDPSGKTDSDAKENWSNTGVKASSAIAGLPRWQEW